MTETKAMYELGENVTLKEFMETLAREYKGRYLPSDFERTIDRLDGYIMGKGECEERNILMSAVNLLRESQNAFAQIKRVSNWKYTAI